MARDLLTFNEKWIFFLLWFLSLIELQIYFENYAIQPFLYVSWFALVLVWMCWISEWGYWLLITVLEKDKGFFCSFLPILTQDASVIMLLCAVCLPPLFRTGGTGKPPSPFFANLENRTEIGIDKLVYDRNLYFCLGLISKPKPKLADTETIFQRENLVTDIGFSMEYFFHHKRATKTKFTAKYTIFLDYFWRSWFIFKLIKAYIPQRSGKDEKI